MPHCKGVSALRSFDVETQADYGILTDEQRAEAVRREELAPLWTAMDGMAERLMNGLPVSRRHRQEILRHLNVRPDGGDLVERLLAEGERFAKGAGVLYRYDRAAGRYQPLDPADDELWGRVFEEFPSAPVSIRGAIYARLKNHRETPELWETPPRHLINCLNGIYDVDGGALLPHTPDHLSTARAWFNAYTGDYVPPEPEWIDAFLSKVIEVPMHIDTFYRALALTVTHNTDHHQIIVFAGTGGNGKSTLMSVVYALFGQGEEHASVHSANLGPLLDRFGLAQARGMSALICPDDDLARVGRNMGVFKSLTGFDPVSAEIKGEQKRERFTPYARLWMATNAADGLDEMDKGMKRRLCVIPFKENAIEKVEFGLKYKLTTQEQIDGMMYHRVLPRLADANRYGLPSAL